MNNSIKERHIRHIPEEEPKKVDEPSSISKAEGTKNMLNTFLLKEEKEREKVDSFATNTKKDVDIERFQVLQYVFDSIIITKTLNNDNNNNNNIHIVHDDTKTRK